MIKTERNNLGKVTAVFLKLGVGWEALPYVPETQTFQPDDDRELQLLGIAQTDADWAELNLGDLPPAIEPLKANKIAELSRQCNGEIVSGFESSALGSSHQYSSEAEDQINLIGAQLLASGGLVVPYVCTDAAGLKTARLHSPDQLRQVYLDGAARKQFLIQKFHSLRLTVEAATSAEAIAAVTW